MLWGIEEFFWVQVYFGSYHPIEEEKGLCYPFLTMSGLGMGEAEEVAGEGDGCDRCGCPDEEKCCPGFWSDRSIPPIFRK